MDRRLTFPIFGIPPNEYSRAFHDDVSRKLNQLVAALRTPGEARNTSIVLTNLPSSDYGLEPGTVFSVDGLLRVSILYSPYATGVSSTGHVGTVSVTT